METASLSTLIEPWMVERDLPHIVQHDGRNLGPALNAPGFIPRDSSQDRLLLGVEAFARHMTDEGWQLQCGLGLHGFTTYGKGYAAGRDEASVPSILGRHNAGTVVVQDKREWHSPCGGCFEKGRDFLRVDELAAHAEIFRVTILKDAQNNRSFHKAASMEIDAHAWIIYYHPSIVHYLSPYLRSAHLIRTYHSVDSDAVPPFGEPRSGIVSGGALNPGVYPMRERLYRFVQSGSRGVDWIPHPGYNANGHRTPEFLQFLATYKVMIADSSIFGYSLRKLVEATACGLRVITDLPSWDVLPFIEGNLTRIPVDTPAQEITNIARELEATYDSDRQERFAIAACKWYDWRACGLRLVQAIADARKNYGRSRSTSGATELPAARLTPGV